MTPPPRTRATIKGHVFNLGDFGAQENRHGMAQPPPPPPPRSSWQRHDKANTTTWSVHGMTFLSGLGEVGAFTAQQFPRTWCTNTTLLCGNTTTSGFAKVVLANQMGSSPFGSTQVPISGGKIIAWEPCDLPVLHFKMDEPWTLLIGYIFIC